MPGHFENSNVTGVTFLSAFQQLVSSSIQVFAVSLTKPGDRMNISKQISLYENAQYGNAEF